MRPPAVTAEHWALETALAILAAIINFLLFCRPRPISWQRLSLWLGLSLLTTISLSTVVAGMLHLFGLPGVQWFRAAGVCWFLASPAFVLASVCWRKSVIADPRRRFLLRAAASVAVAPAASLAYGFSIARRDATVREVELFYPNLPTDLDGIRIVQISDIHLSPFLSRQQLRRAIDQANETRADLAVVTGDLITSWGDPLDDAFAEIKQLRAAAGVYGCHGNHEILAGAEDYATMAGERQGLRFLRNGNATLQFGSARINIGGVDYQKKGHRYLAGAAKLVEPNQFNLLLSHNPDVFPIAARQGWDLTLAGHTHGGQVTLEYLSPVLNPAKFYTPFTYGVYRQNSRIIYVTRGLGTIGIPVRLGAAPEIAVIRLKRAV